MECPAYCNTLQHKQAHTASHSHCITPQIPQHTATCNTPQHTATHCDKLQHTATHCNTRQHTATHSCRYLPAATSWNALKQILKSQLYSPRKQWIQKHADFLRISTSSRRGYRATTWFFFPRHRLQIVREKTICHTCGKKRTQKKNHTRVKTDMSKRAATWFFFPCHRLRVATKKNMSHV